MSNEYYLDELDDANLLALDEIVAEIQDDEICSEQLPDDLHLTALELSQAIAEEIDERGLDPVEGDH